LTRPSILLVGAGGHARSCIDVIEQDGRFAVTGLIGQADEVGSNILGYPVLGTDADIAALANVHVYAMVTVGQIKSAEIRVRLFGLLEESGYVLPAIVSPRAYVSAHATVGAGTIVMHGAIVNAGATVGRNCIVNSQSLIEHDTMVGDHCHIATAATINSGVRVGTRTFIGSGSSIRQCVIIGERSLIGMGERVRADCAPGARVVSSSKPL
jgi:sugar O-acyltransferase (sialic acid O-acetyltransferase NeuD family)